MKKIHLVISLILVLSFALTYNVSARPPAALSPNLGAAESYSVLAGSIVTNTGTSTVSGDVGVSPSIGVPPHVTGFPPGIIGPPGAIHDADAHAAAAQAANTAAFGVLHQTCDPTGDWTGTGLVDLVGMNLVPGVYCADQLSLTGTLTLSGGPGVWIFKSASDFVTSGTANVVGGNALDVWWRVVSSATLGTSTSLIGNILASTSITINTGAVLNGRALAQTGAVTLDTATIYGPVCLEKNVTETVTTTVEEEEEGTTTPLPVVAGLPGTGGAPIRSENSPWVLVGIAGFSTIILVFGLKAYRNTYRRKQ